MPFIQWIDRCFYKGNNNLVQYPRHNSSIDMNYDFRFLLTMKGKWDTFLTIIDITYYNIRSYYILIIVLSFRSLYKSGVVALT